MKRPNHVRVLGKTVTVHDGDQTGEDGLVCSGYYVGSQGKIFVDPRLFPDEARDTLLHECLHALDYPLHLKLNERQVHVLAAGLLALLRDNPHLTKFLMDDLP